MLRCLSVKTEKEQEEEGGEREATDCQITVWQCSVASGTGTTAATAACVVVAVRCRQDREKQRKTRQGQVKEDIAAD